MNRVEKLRALAAFEAAAGAIRAELKEEAAALHTKDGVVPSWKTTDGTTAVSSVRHDRVEVIDPDEFLAWLVEHRPHMVKSVVVPISPDSVKRLLADFAEDGPMRDPETGAVPVLKPGETAQPAVDVPGLEFVKGGAFNTVTITFDAQAKKRVAAAARAWLEQSGGGPLDLERLFQSVYE